MTAKDDDARDHDAVAIDPTVFEDFGDRTDQQVLRIRRRRVVHLAVLVALFAVAVLVAVGAFRVPVLIQYLSYAVILGAVLDGAFVARGLLLASREVTARRAAGAADGTRR